MYILFSILIIIVLYENTVSQNWYYLSVREVFFATWKFGVNQLKSMYKFFIKS